MTYLRQRVGQAAFFGGLVGLLLLIAAVTPGLAVFVVLAGGLFWAGLWLGYKAAREQDIETFIAWATGRKEPPDEPGTKSRV